MLMFKKWKLLFQVYWPDNLLPLQVLFQLREKKLNFQIWLDGIALLGSECKISMKIQLMFLSSVLDACFSTLAIAILFPNFWLYHHNLRQIPLKKVVVVQPKVWEQDGNSSRRETCVWNRWEKHWHKPTWKSFPFKIIKYN